MCIVCVLWEKEKLTTDEGYKALEELITFEQVDKEHAQDVSDMLLDADHPYDIYDGD